MAHEKSNFKLERRRTLIKHPFKLAIVCIGVFLILLFYALPLFHKGGNANAAGCAAVYFPNWNIYQNDENQVKNLPWDRLNRIYHAFWKIIPDQDGYAIVSTDPWADTDTNNKKAHFAQYEKYSNQYPQVDILLSIGGWTCSGYFSQMAASASGRSSFIDSCLKTLETYPFLDGLDLDWEYPGVARKGSGSDEGCPVVADDKTNYTLLLRDLRSALDARFGTGKKMLTVCAGASENILSHQDYVFLHPYVDQINLMTYDMATSHQHTTGHQSPLYGEISADSAVRYLRSQGVPAAKISIGTPFYCHGWKNVDLTADPIGASASGKNKGGSMAWRRIVEWEHNALPVGTPGWHAGYDENAQAAYLWNDDPQSPYYRNLLTYENYRSLDAKLQYLQKNSLGGIIVWQSGGDAAALDFPLLTQIFQTLHP